MVTILGWLALRLRTPAAWLWFVVAQLIMLAATIVGAVLVLPITCGLKAWHMNWSPLTPGTARHSVNSDLYEWVIDQWKWKPLNWIWGNPEDGVSGMDAWVWDDGAGHGHYYNPTGTRWLAYCWNIRNSANQLTYTFGKLVISDPPPYYAGKYFHAGWKMYGTYRRIVLGRNS